MSMTSMNVLISEEKYKNFRVKCLQAGKPVKKVISELIDIYIEDEDEPEPKEKNSSVEKSKED